MQGPPPGAQAAEAGQAPTTVLQVRWLAAQQPGAGCELALVQPSLHIRASCAGGKLLPRSAHLLMPEPAENHGSCPSLNQMDAQLGELAIFCGGREPSPWWPPEVRCGQECAVHVSSSEHACLHMLAALCVFRLSHLFQLTRYSPLFCRIKVTCSLPPRRPPPPHLRRPPPRLLPARQQQRARPSAAPCPALWRSL